MTREEAKELLPIIQAWAKGKEIQFKACSGKWIDVEENEGLSFVYSSSDYRIKPEPKYRPFKNQEECWQEMHNHSDFGWLTRIDTGNFEHISTVCQEKIRFAVSYRYEDAFKYYKFPDGTPFGIKED